MTESQAHKALCQLQHRQMIGAIIPYRHSGYAVQCQRACFWSIRAFQSWLKCQPTWRQLLDEVSTRLEELSPRTRESDRQPMKFIVNS